MMLRSPLPAAAASHTASHVSFPLFFFFLTSARGGAATARPLTSPLLARLRPGWGEGRGRPRSERVPPFFPPPPGPRGLRDAQGGVAGSRGGDGGRGRRWGAPPSPRNQPPGRGTQGTRLSARGAPGWGRPWPRAAGLGPGGGPESLRVPAGSFLRPAAPLHQPGLQAAEPRLREKTEIAKPD